MDSRPSAIAVNPTTNDAYVATDGGVSVIHDASYAGLLYAGDHPVDVGVNPVTNKVYVSEIGGAVAVVDAVSRAVTSVTVGSSPGVVTVNPVTNRIYVAVQGGVTIIDGSTLATSFVALPGGAQDIVLNRSTGKIYVLSAGTLRVLNSAGSVTGTINIGAGGILAVAVNEKTNRVYFTTLAKYGPSLRVVDGATDTVTATIPSPRNIGRLAVNPANNQIYVAADSDSIDGFVQVIDGATRAQVAEIRTASRIVDIVVNPAANKVYVALSGKGTIVVDGRDNSSAVVYAGQDPVDADVNVSTGKVYVANAWSRRVTVIDGAAQTPVKNDFKAIRTLMSWPATLLGSCGFTRVMAPEAGCHASKSGRGGMS